MANGDEEEKARQKARKNVKALGSLSRRKGILPSDVSSRNIGLGTAISEGSDWVGTKPHLSSKRGKSESYKQAYDKELKNNRSSSRKKLKNVEQSLKKEMMKGNF